MRLTDAHCHVTEPEAERPGLVRCVVAGTAPDDWDAIASRVAADPLALAAYGLHPWRVADAPAGWLDDLRRRLEADATASVGEVGLDRGPRATAPLAAQVDALRRQLALAAELDRAATVHCVRATGALLEVLDAEPLPRRGVVVHAFDGSPETARELVRRGCALSYPAALAGSPRVAAFAGVPADRVLVETDAPRAAPSTLAGAYAALATLRGVAVELLAADVDATAARIFG